MFESGPSYREHRHRRVPVFHPPAPTVTSGKRLLGGTVIENRYSPIT